MFSTQPIFRSSMEPSPTRGRLRALALLTAAIALIGGVVPTGPATAADAPTLVITIEAAYSRFPALRVTASDGSILNAVTVVATDPDWTSQSFSCVEGPRCEGALILGGGGDWTFTATATGFAPASIVRAITDWVPSSWVNPDQSVGVSFPDAGPYATYNYSFVLDGGGVPITGETTERAITVSSDRFVAGGTYAPSFGYSADPLRSGVIDGPRSIQDFFLDIAFGAPINVIVTPGNGQVAMSWDPYAGATGYRAYIADLDAGTSSFVDVTTTSHVWTGLTNGTHYEFHVTTQKGTVESVDSVHLTGIPFTIPLPGSALQVTAGDAGGAVNVTFPTSLAAPSAASDALWEISDNGGPFGTAAMTFTGGAIAVGGLANGHDFVLRARAKNAAGLSLTWIESNSFRPLGVPSASTLSAPTAGDSSVSITATFPSSPQAPSTGQVWEISTVTDGVIDGWVSATPIRGENGTFTFSGLTNGKEYRVHVRSTGDTGSSAWSESSSIRPFGAAPMPTITNVGRGDGTVSAAASFNSSKAQPSTASDALWQLKTVTGTVLTGTDLTMTQVDGRFVFSGLTNGSAYQIRVRGSNDHGESDWTAWSDFISPASAPATLTLTPGGMSDGALTVTFPVAPAAAPVTSIVWQIGTVDENGDVTWAPAVPVIDGTTASFAGLVPGTTYEVKATPSNDVGIGPDSVSGEQLFIAVPSKPVILIAGAQKTGLLVALEAGATDVSKPTVGYIWEVARVAGPAAGIWEPASASVLDGFIMDNEGSNVPVSGGYAITGLINGVRYNLHVAAINGAGRSAWAAWNPLLTPASGITAGTIPAADNTTVAGDDSDGDGIPNAIDPDVDGDSIPNPFDPDIDGDGIANLDDDDRDGDDLINALDDTPNGIGSASDHADDWVEPVIPASVTNRGNNTGASTSARPSTAGTQSLDTTVVSAETAAVLSVRFPYPIGHQARGMAVYSAGRGLMPGSEYTLVLHSKSTTLGHGSVDSTGKIQFTSTMPDGVTAGRHELVLTAVSASGKTVTKTLALRVGKDGMLRPLNSTSSGSGGSGSGNVEEVLEDTSLRNALTVGAVILWLLILAAAIWAAIVLRRRRDEDDDERDDGSIDLFEDASVGTR